MLTTDTKRVSRAPRRGANACRVGSTTWSPFCQSSVQVELPPAAYHALVRAAVAIWYLDDPQQPERNHWRLRAERYLMLGAGQLGLVQSG
jgi:hypothetical protein